MRESIGEDTVPFWLRWGVDLFQYWYKWKLWGTGVYMSFVSVDQGNREDLEFAGELVAAGKVKAISTPIPLDDLDAIKKSCEQAKALKGRIGQLAIKLV